MIRIRNIFEYYNVEHARWIQLEILPHSDGGVYLEVSILDPQRKLLSQETFYADDRSDGAIPHKYWLTCRYISRQQLSGEALVAAYLDLMREWLIAEDFVTQYFGNLKKTDVY